ncbi:MAG TPA: FAD:protein FMN transferase [Nevskiaceae bacterium]|nr:FAD:protein FMN transferase [Nevskiaceae bacterium]
MRSRAVYSALVGAALIAACAPWPTEEPRPQLLHREFLAMGTQISVSVRVGDDDRKRAHEAIEDVRRTIDQFGQDWWAWGDGELAHINKELSAGRAAEIPEFMRPLFQRAWEIHRLSDGRYEPRIGALVRLWGFDDVARIRETPPGNREIDRALADLRLAPDYDGGAHYGPARGVTWDFGGIAKGYIVDAALEELRDRGFPDAMVDAGGNLAARGTPGEKPWRVAIHDPRADLTDRDYLATLSIGGEAVNTHADDQRSFISRGQRYGHILNPRTGRPAHGLVSVTVVHHDGALADAGGVALYVAGAKRWRALARKLGLDEVLVVDEDGRVTATEKLAPRLKLAPGVALHIVP